MKLLASLEARSDAVILFGSRACGCHTSRSDFDVLCVGSGTCSIDQSLDVIWVNRSRIESAEWLGSELAGHVAKYGCVLAGKADWFQSTFVSDTAICRKTHAVATRIKVLGGMCELFSDARTQAYGSRIRHDIQRLRLLMLGASVPPSAFLDEDWVHGLCTADMLEATLRSVDLAVPDSLCRLILGIGPGFAKH